MVSILFRVFVGEFFSLCCSSALWLSRVVEVFFVVVFVPTRRFLPSVLLVDMVNYPIKLISCVKNILLFSVINPVIYGFFNENFKREFLLLKHMVKYWMNEYDWKLCKDCKNYLGSLSFLNNLCHALSFSFCQGCHQCHTGVHFSFYVLPSWADQGSCAHKCVC